MSLHRSVEQLPEQLRRWTDDPFRRRRLFAEPWRRRIVRAGIAVVHQHDLKVTLLDLPLGDTSHAWPVVLPDGVHFLYFVRSAQDERRGVYLGRIDRPATRADSMLLSTDSNVVYVPLPGTGQGLLLYVVDGRVETRVVSMRGR